MTPYMSIVSVTRTPSEQFAPPAESNRTNKKSGWNGMELQLVMTRFINLGMQEAQLRPTWRKEIIHGEVGLDWGELA